MAVKLIKARDRQTQKGRHLSRNQGWKSPATGRLGRLRGFPGAGKGFLGCAGGPAGCCGTDAGGAPTWARMNRTGGRMGQP
jgi:hypothetical protein